MSAPTPPQSAILITGGFRTFDKVFPQIYKHVLAVNNCVLFILCETDKPDKLFEILNAYPDLKIGCVLHAPSFRDKQYQAIETMTFASDRPALTYEILDRAQKTDKLNWTEKGISFIKSSGSILQHYQVWKLWQRVLEYERTHNMQFTHCMRTRCDITFNKPIFIHDNFEEHNSWYTEYQISNKLLTSPSNYHHTTHELASVSTTLKTDYVITFSVDLVWIARRQTFDKLSQIVFHYGLWNSGHTFTFNAETTFHEFCTHYNIHHYGIIEKDFPLYSYSLEDSEKYIMVILRG
jgi:hypothetical protein